MKDVGLPTMDIDTRSKYLRIAKACADAAVERTSDPKVREMLLNVSHAVCDSRVGWMEPQHPCTNSPRFGGAFFLCAVDTRP